VSTCIRNGVRYKRHHWQKQKALVDVVACNNCGRVQGGVFESGDQEGPTAPIGSGLPDRDLSSVHQPDGGLQLPAGDGGASGGNQGVEAT
jgi:hypothetical protein